MHSRREIAELASTGHFLEAAAAERTNEALRRQQVERHRRRLEEDDALEWQAFYNAREQWLVQREAAAVDAEVRRREQILNKFAFHQHTHADELAAYEERMLEDTMRKPLPPSQALQALRQERDKLVLQNRFTEAAEVQDQLKRVGAAERTRFWKQQEAAARSKVQRRAVDLHKKEEVAWDAVHAKLDVEALRREKKVSRLAATLDHMATDMRTVQNKQRRVLDTRGFVPPMSNAVQSKAHRGTQLGRRVMGDTYSLPSLSRLYGPLLTDDTG